MNSIKLIFIVVFLTELTEFTSPYTHLSFLPLQTVTGCEPRRCSLTLSFGDLAVGTDVSVAAGWEGASASELVLWAARLFVWGIGVLAVALCRRLRGCQRFEEPCCLHLQVHYFEKLDPRRLSDNTFIVTP